jgi:hypothetical protein
MRDRIFLEIDSLLHRHGNPAKIDFSRCQLKNNHEYKKTFTISSATNTGKIDYNNRILLTVWSVYL